MSAHININLALHALTLESSPSCPSCDESFCYRYQLEWHYKWKHQADGKLFICSNCNGSFTDEQCFKAHVMTHGEDTSYVCERCNSRFVTELQLTFHQIVKHRRNSKTKDPDVCPGFNNQETSLLEMDDIFLNAPVSSGPCRGCFTRKSFTLRHSKRNKFSKCSFATCFKEKVCKHGNRWTSSL
ncbi:uncharacterized protein CDAR_482741 [Caerostris darwini]|uniref:C2H2-type domain-containing protein n=1 Tax=Caerostris darwini TaxID=1538125 RepID=A0AAV4W9T1_9ARAC|nr:uncharacterized protein CDAR_482741 [Caerostris darwini]